MRAETWLGKLVSNLINSTRYDFQQLQAFWGFGDEFKQLQRSLSAIADLVERLEAKEERSDEMSQLKEVAYEADDLLSELAYETTRLKIQYQESFHLNVKANAENDEFRLQMVNKIKKVIQSLKNFKSQAVPVGRVRYSAVDSIKSRARTNSVINMPVVGRQADVAKIVNLLMSLCYQKVTIVPIIGMAGIGKTELAKLVSQEVRERKLFDVLMWAHVSDDFDEKRIFEEMSTGIIEGSNKLVRQRLGKELAGKRFLLVLDDVWDDVCAWWNHFKTWLLEVCTTSGNAIIVTTRSNQVAYTVEASTQHWYKLSLMSDNEVLVYIERHDR